MVQIHKLMAGLLDQYLLADNDLALSIVLDMADYFVTRVDVRRCRWTLVDIPQSVAACMCLHSFAGSPLWLRCFKTAAGHHPGQWHRPLARDAGDRVRAHSELLQHIIQRIATVLHACTVARISTCGCQS